MMIRKTILLGVTALALAAVGFWAYRHAAANDKPTYR